MAMNWEFLSNFVSNVKGDGTARKNHMLPVTNSKDSWDLVRRGEFSIHYSLHATCPENA